MLGRLLKIRFTMILHTILNSGTRRKKSSPVATVALVLLLLYALCALCFMFGFYSSLLCGPYCSAGLGWLYFALLATAGFALAFIGSVFTTYSQLFASRDNDLLLSLPLRPRDILLSRSLVLWLSHLLFCSVCMIPGEVVYCLQYGARLGQILAFVAVLFCLTLLVMFCSTLVGWLLGLLTRKMPGKNIFTTVFSLAALAVYMVVCMRMNTMLQNLADNMQAVEQSLNGVALLVHIGRAIADANLTSLLIVAAAAVLPLVVLYAFISRSFISIVTAKVGGAHGHYSLQDERQRTPRQALLGKETTRLVSSSAYMVNGAMGVIFSILCVFVVISQRATLDGVLAQLPGGARSAGVGAALCALLSLLSSSNMITVPSVSLEGSSLWVTKTIPVPTLDILMAKVWLHLRICLPVSLVVSVFFLIFFPTTPAMMVLMVVTPLLYTVFCALVGLLFNLRFPHLDWLSEAQAIKQGVAVLLNMMATFFAVIIPVLLYLALVFLAHLSPDITLYTVGATLCMVALNALLYHVLRTWGVRAFEALC